MAVRKRDEEDESQYYYWLEQPGIYVDTSFAILFEKDAIVRIAFGEIVGRGFHPLWRAGITMSIPAARRLAKRLNEMLNEFDNPEPRAPEKPSTTE